MVVTVKVSVRVSPTLSACTVLLAWLIRVGPYAGGRHREGAKAARTRGRRADRRERIGCIVDVGVGERPDSARGAERGIGNAAGLDSCA